MLKGEDKIVKIALTDEDGNVIDPLSYVGFVVVIFEQQGQIIEQYSLNSDPAFKTVNNIDSVSGTFEINLQRSTVKKYLKKTLKGEVKVAETNSDFEDNLFESIAKFEIDLLSDSESANIDIPL